MLPCKSRFHCFFHRMQSSLYLPENKKRTTEWLQGLGNSGVPFAGTKSGFMRSISQSKRKEQQAARIFFWTVQKRGGIRCPQGYMGGGKKHQGVLDARRRAIQDGANGEAAADQRAMQAARSGGTAWARSCKKPCRPWLTPERARWAGVTPPCTKRTQRGAGVREVQGEKALKPCGLEKACCKAAFARWNIGDDRNSPVPGCGRGRRGLTGGAGGREKEEILSVASLRLENCRISRLVLSRLETPGSGGFSFDGQFVQSFGLRCPRSGRHRLPHSLNA